MRRLPTLFLVLPLLAGCVPEPSVTGPKTLELREDVALPDGRVGNQYFRNDMRIAEEWDSDGDGRFDAWIDFRDGEPWIEAWDTDGDGVADARVRRHLDSGDIILLERGVGAAGGVPGLRFEYVSEGEWLQETDRDGDGSADMTVVCRGARDLFDMLSLEPQSFRGALQALPADFIDEVADDTDRDGVFDAWTRYDDGVPSETGVDTDGDGSPDTWRSVAASPEDDAASAPDGTDAAPVGDEGAPSEEIVIVPEAD